VLLLIMVFGSAMRQVLYDGIVAVPLAFKLALTASLAGLIYLTAPIGSDDSQPPSVEMDSNEQGEAIDPAAVGEIRGTVLLTGTPPEPEQLTLFAGCETLADEPIYDDRVVASDGKLKNTFIWIRQGWERWAVPPAPAAEVELDQRACVYKPRVLGARVDQPITFINSDPLFHNVRTVIGERSVFNLNMPAQDQRITRTFKRPEVMVQARCDVHPWMRSYIGVVPHPWFAISAEDGSFALTGVPPGEYVVEAWHEVYGTQTATVTVTARGEAEQSFTFAAE
ncbi:MAG: carboxypeptidase regulatory-like domain-containing protein, partial [Myxococcota bacterium]